jgi:signal transduction histidine kinase
VQGYLDSTLRRAQNLTLPQREGLEVAATETNRTIRLLEQLLQLARLDSGQMPLMMTAIDLENVAREAISMAEADYLETLSTPSRIRLQPTDSPVVVKADEEKLRTVLIELLDNSLRYSTPGSLVYVQLARQHGWGVVQVQDKGPGVPLGSQPHLFDPFYRIDENRSRSTGGTGLGLTLVRSIVEAMGGEVSLQSEPGQGSVFTIRLPL